MASFKKMQYWLGHNGRWKNWSLIPRRGKGFLYVTVCTQTLWTHPAYLPGGKVAGHEANHLPPASAMVKNAWRFISTQLRVLWRGAQLGRMTNFIAPFHARSNSLLIAAPYHPKLYCLYTNIGQYIKYTYYIYVLPFRSCTIWREDSCFFNYHRTVQT
jgi:hypothetical protein